MLNIVLFFVFQIAAQFAHFFIYGEGALSDKYTTRVSLFFVVVHMVILTVLFWRQTIIKSAALYIITILSVIALYIYLNFMLPEI
jgi:hypothetical protein